MPKIDKEKQLKLIRIEKEALLKKLLQIEEEKRIYRESNRCFFFQPYRWQHRLRETVSQKNITVCPAPNKIGKCLTYQTLVETPNGNVSIGSLFKSGMDFDVYAWDGKRKVVAHAKAPFKKKGFHECYRIMMSDGRFIEAADHHLILTYCGWISVERLASYNFPLFSQNQPETNSGLSQSIHVSSGLRSSGKRSDYQDDYLGDCHPHDEQLLSDLDIAQAFSPLQGDVRRHISTGLKMGVLENKCSDILSRFSNLPSSLYDLILTLVRPVVFLFRNSYRPVLLLQDGRIAIQQPSIAVSSYFPLTPELKQQSRGYQDTSPCLSPLYVDTNKIVSINPIGSQEVFDFTVERYHNYFSGGLIHHNSGMMALIAISWVMGFDPWNEVRDDHPEAVKYRKHWYRASSLGIKPPVRIRITGEDWKHHVGQTIVPELKKWAPAGVYETKKNEQGVEYLWTFENGSTIEILTHTQEYDISESWMGHGWLPDEPPPKPMYGAMSRGIFLSGGKVVMSMVPLKEAWVLDDLVLSGRSDIGVIDDLTILDNEDLYNDEVSRLKVMGLSADQIAQYFDLLLYEDKAHDKFVSDKGKKAKAFLDGIVPGTMQDKINDLKLFRFVQDTDPNEAPSRFGGKFKALIGRVLKKWNKERHWIEPFEIPTDWPVVCMIDFHLVKPHAISFHAVNPQGIKFIFKEIWENLSPEETADAIIRYVSGNALRCELVQIDPLSKGDTAYMKNRLGDDLRDSYSIIEERLAEHGIMLEVASKDKDSGIRNIEAALEGPNGLATYYIFNTCERHLFEVLRWVYDENGKPSKENDHFMENWYRATLAGLKYEPLRPKSHVFDEVKSETAWMGA